MLSNLRTNAPDYVVYFFIILSLIYCKFQKFYCSIINGTLPTRSSRFDNTWRLDRNLFNGIPGGRSLWHEYQREHYNKRPNILTYTFEHS